MSTVFSPTELDQFLMECSSVCAGNLKEITRLRARAQKTGLSLARMRLAAEAANVELVPDGKELKVVPLFAIKRQEYTMTPLSNANAASAQQNVTPLQSAIEVPLVLMEGETYAGLLVGKDGESSYHLILLPEEARAINWSGASEWAKGVDGDLPTLRELALLFANLREHFQRFWYWSNVEHETRPQLVWGQNFASGIQTVYGRPFWGHARAVRRVNFA